MPIITADFSSRLSGGAANAVGNASIGGAKSSVAVSAATDGLFDAVSAAQAAAGLVEYRCIYLHNANGADLMTAARVWINANTPLAGTTLAIGVGAAAVNATEGAIANEATAPAGVSFSEPASAAAGLALGNIPAGQHRAIWLRRTVTAGAGPSASDTFTLGFDCETA
jgi:hypothetical protein